MVCFYTIPFLHHYLGHYSYASDNGLDQWTEFLQRFGSIAIAIAAISAVVTEIGGWITVTAQAFQDWRKKRQEKKIAEAQQKFAECPRDLSESERVSEIERVAKGNK